jgi:hypothetical protein
LHIVAKVAHQFAKQQKMSDQLFKADGLAATELFEKGTAYTYDDFILLPGNSSFMRGY